MDLPKPSRVRRGAKVLTAKVHSIEHQRDPVVCSLIEYFGKSNDDLFLKCQENDRSSQSQTMKILLVYSQDDPVDVALAIDGAEVLTKCGNKTKACILLMGLMYALNLEYPPQMKNTFENGQKEEFL